MGSKPGARSTVGRHNSDEPQLSLRSCQHSRPRLSGNLGVSEEFVTFGYYRDTKEQV